MRTPPLPSVNLAVAARCPVRRTLLEAASAADLLVVGARRRKGDPGYDWV
ncbi:hypothetical protein [Streptomyces sp. SAI-127]|nr:hypothetical protein [Streptomyces sp. SAI-127]